MKTALITGANKSIGFETARQLLAQGYFVFLGSRDLKNGEKAVAQLNAEGFTQLKAIQIDVTDPASIEAAQQAISSQAASLDALINNAGISGGFPQNPTTTDTALIRQTFETNFFGAINVTRAFLPLLEKAALPRIVNVTSGLASLTFQSDPTWKYYPVKGAAYGSSKTALNAYTIALAYELRDTPFKVNAIDPGYTATDFNQHRGPGNIPDAAAIIVKYATIDADGPTGKFFSNEILGGGEYPW